LNTRSARTGNGKTKHGAHLRQLKNAKARAIQLIRSQYARV